MHTFPYTNIKNTPINTVYKPDQIYSMKNINNHQVVSSSLTRLNLMMLSKVWLCSNKHKGVSVLA